MLEYVTKKSLSQKEGEKASFLLLIDNFDSFTYNLVHAFKTLGLFVRVIRNDALSVADCLSLKPDYLVISPGPGNPQQSGVCMSLIQQAAGLIPIFGVCLGHQCLVECFGGRVVKARNPMHGKTSAIYHDAKGIFQGLPQGFEATRYHSLIADKDSLPDTLEITAQTEDGEIMGVRHCNYRMEGVQFHPESILTAHGLTLLQNFLTHQP